MTIMRKLKESDAHGNGLPIIRSYQEHSKFTVFVCDCIVTNPLFTWEELARLWNQRIKGKTEVVEGNLITDGKKSD